MPRPLRNLMYAILYGSQEGWPAVFNAVISKAPTDWVHHLPTRNALTYLIMLYEHEDGENTCPTMVIDTEDGLLIEKRDGEVTIEVLCKPDGTVENTLFVGSQVVEMKSIMLGPLTVVPDLTNNFGVITLLKETFNVQSGSSGEVPARVAGTDHAHSEFERQAPVLRCPSDY